MNDKRDDLPFLIVGQGLAGSLLAWFLIQKNIPFRMVDQGHETASSKKAAGIINPITGRRFVKSWMIESLVPFAENTYSAISESLGKSYYYPQNILRVLFKQIEENEFFDRSGDPAFAHYVATKPDELDWKDQYLQGVYTGELQGGGRCDIPLLIKDFRSFFQEKDLLEVSVFDYSALEDKTTHAFYKGEAFRGVIFCEGASAQKNPYFNYLPFQTTKGEILIIRIPGLDCKKMLKHRLFFVPIGEELYWVGANYVHDFEDDLPTKKGKEELLGKVEKALNRPFEVIKHQAGIRPTVRDRRPFIGVHSKFPSYYLFNGLGTKGASLGPYWANAFVEYLLEGTGLDKEVDLVRYDRFLEEGAEESD